MSDCVAVIDLGTTNVKCMVVDVEGRELASAARAQQVHAPHGGWAEQEAEDWWDASSALLRDVVGAVGSDRVAAVTVTNQQITTVPVDAAGRPLDRAILWMDTRTHPLAAEFNPDRASEVFERTGIPLSTSWAALRPLWWQRERPEVAARASAYVTADAFLYERLCGRRVTDQSNACFGAFDIRRRAWDERLCGYVELDPDTLPEVVESGTPIGEIGVAAAASTGLAAGTAVVAGGSDQPCAAIGLGAVGDNVLAATTGTGTFMVQHVTTPVLDARLLTNCAALPGLWVLHGVHYVSGALLRWFRDELWPGGGYEEIAAAAAAAPAGADGVVVLPYFQGARTPVFDDHARGVVYGLTLHHHAGHIARAILESNAFGLRQTIAVLDELDAAPEEVRLGGGGAESDLWCQIQADVTGRPCVRTTEVNTTGLGAALLAITGLGLHRDMDTAVSACVRAERTFEPNVFDAEVHERRFASYEALHRALSERFAEDFD